MGEKLYTERKPDFGISGAFAIVVLCSVVRRRLPPPGPVPMGTRHLYVPRANQIRTRWLRTVYSNFLSEEEASYGFGYLRYDVACVDLCIYLY